jgi:hypothetical protein
MYSRQPSRWASGLGGLGSGAPIPRDLIVLLVVLFVTFSLQFFDSTAGLIGLLRLSPAFWQFGFVWQVGTYGFTGYGAPSLWFLLELLILFWFGRDVYSQMGRKSFWTLLVVGVVAAGVAAVVVQLAGSLLSGLTGPLPFVLLQGQHVLVVILIAAFATLYRNATIYLFFILPIQARWFLPLEILFAFIGFLGTRDFAGFVGICVAVGLTYSLITPGGARRLLHESWLRLRQAWIRARLSWMRKRRGIRVVRDEEKVRKGPWVH